jgi:hypothetical protein
VWVYDPATSTVNSQVVQIATADGNDAVVASGLTPGMQVVATGRACALAGAESHDLSAKNGCSARA